MKNIFFGSAFLFFSTTASAETLPFNLSITGSSFNIQKTLELSDIGEGKTSINFVFKDKNGKAFTFDLNYKKLPRNRSYPTNLDIVIKDSNGNKAGYLFFAINKVAFLKKMGIFGLIVDIDDEPVDVNFSFDSNKQGNLQVASLGNERFVQDTLVSKFNFQMIRPVILPLVKPGVRSQTYDLDNHPYAVSYTLRDIDAGKVQFQHNLYQLKEGGEVHLLERIYFQAGSLDTLREAMYAGKYFHKEDGAFKLVFYPAMGQTESPK